MQINEYELRFELLAREHTVIGVVIQVTHDPESTCLPLCRRKLSCFNDSEELIRLKYWSWEKWASLLYDICIASD